MAQVTGVNIAAPVVPYDSQETHPTHMAQYGKGGWRTCQTVTERNSIPTQRCEIGMIVFVMEDGKAYQLQSISSPLTNANWSEYQPGLIWNKTEPQASIETPDPQTANYYEGDDYVYRRISGIWKRTPHTEF
jgi:hypothetical protein